MGFLDGVEVLHALGDAGLGLLLIAFLFGRATAHRAGVLYLGYRPGGCQTHKTGQ